ncbi:CaiB/BaiF CoA transferase family protein [Aeromicrobium sp. JJY06]|uniref:CaiB/BaiF CoA transferase family protein n=1 Tax=Aeromicrobium sp. JJY06 TaxID=3373478 RepID=UPI00376EA8A5
MTAAPLDGILVADFSRVLAGPMATALLADLGATVVKVERPGTGDDTRAWGPPWTETTSAYFESANRTKRSVTLDLRDAHDLRLAHELVRRADVLVENFRTGTLDRYGLGWDQAAALNPALVYCSLTGYGSGAGASLPGYDFVIQAVGGLMSITGPDADHPHKVGVALVDVLTGKDAAIGILAALAHRARTGVGEHVEVSLLTSLLGSLANQASNWLTTGRPPAPLGNRHPSIAPYETLHCADGLIAVACGNDGQFRKMAAALGRVELADDVRFCTNAVRVQHRDVLVAILEEVLLTRDAQHWYQLLVAADVPVGVVGDIGSAFELADRLGLDPTREVGAGHPPQVRHPITYSHSQVVPPAAPPGLGEHNDQIRRWLAEDRRTP